MQTVANFPVARNPTSVATFPVARNPTSVATFPLDSLGECCYRLS